MDASYIIKLKNTVKVFTKHQTTHIIKLPIKTINYKEDRGKINYINRGRNMDEIILIEETEIAEYKSLDSNEQIMLEKASQLMNVKFPEHALLEIWNSAIHNLRRRVEAYSIDMFLSSISSMSGRKNYKMDGDSISERWANVDDENLIKGASQLGVLNRKAEKALEMIEWMRNHASPSHDSDDCVTQEDVIGLVLIIKKNLFELPMPDPAHSPVGMIEPIKKFELNEEQIELYIQQINEYSNKDIRMLFGFSMDVICKGEEPVYTNICALFPNIWEKATDDLKTNMGMKFHNYMFYQSSDSSDDVNAKSRIYEMLIMVDGIKYIPESTRAVIYRKLAKNLHDAKDTVYGWAQEERAAKALAQAGTHVPSTAFEEVYQEILCVWCGNYWGRSCAYAILRAFIFDVPTQDKLKLARLFITNDRVKEELFQNKPNEVAVSLLNEIKASLNVTSHIVEIENIIDAVMKMK